jgi:hypothetical protein
LVALLFWEQEVAGSNPVIPKTPLVQLVERRFPKPDVVGSSPTRRDLKITFILLSQKKIKFGSILDCSQEEEQFFQLLILTTHPINFFLIIDFPLLLNLQKVIIHSYVHVL